MRKMWVVLIMGTLVGCVNQAPQVEVEVLESGVEVMEINLKEADRDGAVISKELVEGLTLSEIGEKLMEVYWEQYKHKSDWSGINDFRILTTEVWLSDECPGEYLGNVKFDIKPKGEVARSLWATDGNRGTEWITDKTLRFDIFDKREWELKIKGGGGGGPNVLKCKLLSEDAGGDVPKRYKKGVRMLRSAAEKLEIVDAVRWMLAESLKSALCNDNENCLDDFRIHQVSVTKGSCRNYMGFLFKYDIRPSTERDLVQMNAGNGGRTGDWLKGKTGVGQVEIGEEYWMIGGWGTGGGGGAPCLNTDGSEEEIARFEWKGPFILHREEEEAKRQIKMPQEIVRRILRTREEIIFQDVDDFSNEATDNFRLEKLFWQWMGFDGFLQEMMDGGGTGVQALDRGYVVDQEESYYLSEYEYLVTTEAVVSEEDKREFDFEQKYFFIFENTGDEWKVRDIYTQVRPNFTYYVGRQDVKYSDIKKGGAVIHFWDDQRKGEEVSELGRLPETKEEYLSEKWFLPMP